MKPAEFTRYLADWWVINRLNYNNENTGIKHVKNVIAGNSLVHLFIPELLKKEFAGFDIVGRGIGGDMTDLFLERLDDNILTLKPSTIIIEIGGNDIIGGKCLSFAEGNIHKIVLKIKTALPAARIIFVTIPPTQEAKLNAVVPAFNLFLYSLTRKYSNLVVVDLWEYMRLPDKVSIRPEFTRPKDSIHFNEKGYELMGRLLRPLLTK